MKKIKNICIVSFVSVILFESAYAGHLISTVNPQWYDLSPGHAYQNAASQRLAALKENREKHLKIAQKNYAPNTNFEQVSKQKQYAIDQPAFSYFKTAWQPQVPENFAKKIEQGSMDRESPAVNTKVSSFAQTEDPTLVKVWEDNRAAIKENYRLAQKLINTQQNGEIVSAGLQMMSSFSPKSAMKSIYSAVFPLEKTQNTSFADKAKSAGSVIHIGQNLLSNAQSLPINSPTEVPVNLPVQLQNTQHSTPQTVVYKLNFEKGEPVINRSGYSNKDIYYPGKSKETPTEYANRLTNADAEIRPADSANIAYKLALENSVIASRTLPQVQRDLVKGAVTTVAKIAI